MEQTVNTKSGAEVVVVVVYYYFSAGAFTISRPF